MLQTAVVWLYLYAWIKGSEMNKDLTEAERGGIHVRKAVKNDYASELDCFAPHCTYKYHSGSWM